MSRKLAPLAALTLVVLVSAVASAHDRRRPPIRQTLVSMHVEDAAGRPLPTFRHHGQTYVLGQQGQRYAVRVRNHGPRRVEVVLAIDGRDAVSGQITDLVRHRGYVIPPYASLRVEGFRRSMSSVAAFRFTDPSDSYAGRLGTPQRVGIIALAAYPERVFEERPLVVPEHGHHDFDGPPPPTARRGPRSPGHGAAPDDSVGSPRSEARRAPGRVIAPRPRPPQNNLGTQYGETRSSRVVEVDFERAHRTRPAQRLTLRYDDVQGLRARGIEPFPRPEPRPLPRPISVDHPARFAPPPPPRHRWQLGVWMD